MRSWLGLGPPVRQPRQLARARLWVAGGALPPGCSKGCWEPFGGCFLGRNGGLMVYNRIATVTAQRALSMGESNNEGGGKGGAQG